MTCVLPDITSTTDQSQPDPVIPLNGTIRTIVRERHQYRS